MALDFNNFSAENLVSGGEATAILKWKGSVYDLFYVKSLDATVEKQKDEVKLLRKRGVQHKANGFSGTGSMTIYAVSSIFKQMMAQYAQSGRDFYFNLTVINSDPTAGIGSQEVELINCNLDSIVIAKIDVDSDNLEEDVEFTFGDFKILKAYN